MAATAGEDAVDTLASWPWTRTSYTVASDGADAAVVVGVELDAVRCQPGPTEPHSEVVARAAADQRQYEAVRDRILQDDVTGAVHTSLAPLPVAVDVDALRRYVVGAHALLGSVAALQERPVDTADAPTIDAACAFYGIAVDSLAAANADRDLDTLFAAAELAVPQTAPFAAGATVAGLCGDADPAALLLEDDNAGLPLRAGTELTVPRRDAVVEAAMAAADLAASNRVSLARLAAANQDTPGLLAPGFTFVVDGMTVSVPADSPSTLAGIAAEFGVSAARVVAANADRPGMFCADAVLVVDGYVAQAGDTLLHNGSGIWPAQLAPLNTETVDLFADGAELFLGTVATAVPPSTTLADFAEAEGVSPASLLRHNGGAAVLAAAVPGGWSWPTDPSALRVPYTVQAGDTLAGVAARFLATDAVHLAHMNASMPGVLAGGARIDVGSQSVTVGQPSSLRDALALFDPPVELEPLVEAVSSRADVLAPGALLLCPPGVLAAATPAEAAAPFGVPAASLLAANAGAAGLVVGGQVLAAWHAVDGAAGAPTETTAPGDTLTAVVARFRSRGVFTSIEAIAAANTGVAFLRVGAPVLVPPLAAALRAPIGPDWSFPAPVFPLQTVLALTLPSSPNAVDRTTVPPRAPIADFAARLQEALPAVRVAGHDALWAAVFGADAVAKVHVAAPAADEPVVFALRPLTTTTVQGRVQAPVLDTATGALIEGPVQEFHSIDLDAWAHGLLADIDDVLSPTSARAAAGLNDAAHDRLVKTKQVLAAAIAEGIDVVTDHGRPAADAAVRRAAAVNAMRDRLMGSLAGGYSSSVLLQYDADVASPSGVGPARLHLTPEVKAGEAEAAAGTVPLAAGKSHPSFAVTVADVPRHPAVELQLDCLATGVDVDARPPLTFVTPLRNGSPAAIDVDLGAPTVPLPVRALPPSPGIVEHSAVVPSSPSSLAAAVHWQYRLSLQHRAAAQDAIGFEVVFNAPAPTAPTGAAADVGLFPPLARHAAVSGPLKRLLAGGAQQAVPGALDSFATLAADIADAWARHWTQAGAAAVTGAVGAEPVGDVYRFVATLAADGDGQWYEALSLARSVSSGPGDVGFPDVVCITDVGTQHPLERQADDPARVAYRFPPAAVPAGTEVVLQCTFPPVHVASYQSASARAWVTRNAALLGPDGPATSSGFVCTTPVASSAAPVVPFIDVSQPITIGDWPDHPLEAVVKEVFGGDEGRNVAIACSYVSTVAPGDPPTEAELPVFLATREPFTANTIAGITAMLNQWLVENNPPPNGGTWVFSVSLYSSVDPSSQRPLLHLERLRSSTTARAATR